MLNLKEIRENAGLQQRELATQLNRTIACISSWETGKTEPSLANYQQTKTTKFGRKKSSFRFY